MIVESNEVRLLFEGTFLENSDEIRKNLEKFPDTEITNNNLEVQVSSSENHLMNLDIMKNTLDEIDEGVNQDEKDTNVDINDRDDDFVIQEKNVKFFKEEIEKPDDLCHKTSKLGFVSKLEKLIYVRKVIGNLWKHSNISTFTLSMHGHDNEHKLVVADVLPSVRPLQLFETPVDNHLISQDVTRLDILMKPICFPWRPGDQSCTFYSALVLHANTVMVKMFVMYSLFLTASCQRQH